jgi:SepF-like predicted cell division protein (DUF552 family)
MRIVSEKIRNVAESLVHKGHITQADRLRKMADIEDARHLQEAINILSRVQTVNDLRVAADHVKAGNVVPKDIELAIQVFDVDKTRAQGYIDKAISDLKNIITKK